MTDFNFSEKELEFLIRALVDNFADNEKDIDNISDPFMSELLIGKLRHASSKNFYICNNAYSKARKNKFNEDNPLDDKVLFMGAGNNSIIWKNKLHRRLEYAIGILGGMQQNGGQGTAFDYKANREDKEKLKLVAIDILNKLGLKPDDLK